MESNTRTDSMTETETENQTIIFHGMIQIGFFIYRTDDLNKQCRDQWLQRMAVTLAPTINDTIDLKVWKWQEVIK